VPILKVQIIEAGLIHIAAPTRSRAPEASKALKPGTVELAAPLEDPAALTISLQLSRMI
jgi:hypothetical protein